MRIILLLMAVMLLMTGADARYSPGLEIAEGENITLDGGYIIDGSLPEMINIKSFGAVGDGITNDTAAWNAAVAVANDGWDWPGSDNNLYSHANATLFLPDGNYNLTPGATAEVKCNIYGPGATLQAHTAASGALLSVGTTAFRNVKLNGLHGYYLPYTEGQATTYLQSYGYKGTGLNLSNSQIVYCNFDINQIAGFDTGIWFGNYYHSSHIASNKINVNVLQHCQYGLLQHSYSSGIEENQININYVVGCNVTSYAKSPHNNTGLFTDNEIRFGVVESHITGSAYGIVLVGQNCTNNKFEAFRILPASIYDAVTTAGDSPGLPTGNTFVIHDANSAPKIAILGDGNELIYKNGRGNVVMGTNSAATTIPGEGGVELPFTESLDELGQWDGSDFVAKSSGLYLVQGFAATAAYAQTAGKVMYGYIELNDVPIFTQMWPEWGNTKLPVGLSFSSSVYLEPGDKIEFLIYRTGSGNQALSGNTQYNWMQISKI